MYFLTDPPSAPKFTTTPSNASATEGTMVVFYCQASGSPSPTISWKRINGTIPSDRRSQPRPGALGISNLQPLDDGRYACVAKNSQGESVAYVHLSIKGISLLYYSTRNTELFINHVMLQKNVNKLLMKC